MIIQEGVKNEEEFLQSTKEINSYLLCFRDRELEREYFSRRVFKYKQIGYVMCVIHIIIVITEFAHLFVESQFPSKKLMYLVLMLAISILIFILLYFKEKWFNITYSLYFTAFITMNGWYLYDSDLYKDDIKLGMDDALTKGYILSAGLVLGLSGSNYILRIILFAYGTVIIYIGQSLIVGSQFQMIIQISLIILLYTYVTYQRENAHRKSYLKQKQIDQYNNIMNNQIPHCLFAAKFNSNEQRIELFKCNARAQKEFKINSNEDFDQFISNTFLMEAPTTNENKQYENNNNNNNCVINYPPQIRTRVQTWENSLKGQIRSLIDLRMQQSSQKRNNIGDLNKQLEQSQTTGTNAQQNSQMINQILPEVSQKYPIIKLKLKMQEGVGTGSQISVQLSLFKLFEYYIIITVDKWNKKKQLKSSKRENQKSSNSTNESQKQPITSLQQKSSNNNEEISKRGTVSYRNGIEIQNININMAQQQYVSNNQINFQSQVEIYQQQQQLSSDSPSSPQLNIRQYNNLTQSKINTQSILMNTLNTAQDDEQALVSQPTTGNNIQQKRKSDSSYDQQTPKKKVGSNGGQIWQSPQAVNSAGNSNKSHFNNKSLNGLENLNGNTQLKPSLPIVKSKQNIGSNPSALSTSLSQSQTVQNINKKPSTLPSDYQLNRQRHTLQGRPSLTNYVPISPITPTNNGQYFFGNNFALAAMNNTSSTASTNNNAMILNTGMMQQSKNYFTNLPHPQQQSMISVHSGMILKEQMFDACFEVIGTTKALIKRYKDNWMHFRSNEKVQGEQQKDIFSVEEYTASIMQQILVVNSNFTKINILQINSHSFSFVQFSLQQIVSYLKWHLQPLLSDKSINLLFNEHSLSNNESQSEIENQNTFIQSDLNAIKLILANIVFYISENISTENNISIAFTVLSQPTQQLQIQITMPYIHSTAFNLISTLHYLHPEQVAKDYITLHKFHADLRVAFNLLKKLNQDECHIDKYVKFTSVHTPIHMHVLTLKIPISSNNLPLSLQSKLQIDSIMLPIQSLQFPQSDQIHEETEVKILTEKTISHENFYKENIPSITVFNNQEYSHKEIIEGNINHLRRFSEIIKLQKNPGDDQCLYAD